MILIMPETIFSALKKKYLRNRWQWLDDIGQWPLQMKLGMPTEQQAIQNIQALKIWVQGWQQWPTQVNIEWCEKRWQKLGIQRLPNKLCINSPQEVACLLNDQQLWQCMVKRHEALVAHWPQLMGKLNGVYTILMDLSDNDFNCLLDVLAWLLKHPNSDLYLRQVPVSSVDSKWIEQHKRLIKQLLLLIYDDQSKSSFDFFQLTGLRTEPNLIRIRLLDKRLREKFMGLDDIALPIDTFKKLTIKPRRVIIIENLRSGLALPDMHNTLAIMGLGYAVEKLHDVDLLKFAECDYWGDIDTHGFAILNRARKYIPHLKSCLMDEACLLSHRHLWSYENTPIHSGSLEDLTDSERQVYAGLVNQTWGSNIRLEQERIAWDYVLNHLIGKANK